ncbi:hypothetical protein [Paenibacillus sp. R14(2021)]
MSPHTLRFYTDQDLIQESWGTKINVGYLIKRTRWAWNHYGFQIRRD